MESAVLDPAWAQALVAAALELLFVFEPVGSPEVTDFRVLYANSAGARLAGIGVEELVGRTVNEVSQPIGGSFRSDLKRAYTEQVVVRRETTVIAPDLDATKAVYRIIPFNGLLAIAAINKSTERRAETESETLRRLLAAQIESSLTASALIHPKVESGSVVDFSFVHANNRAAELLGVAVDHETGTNSLTGATMSSQPADRGARLKSLVESCVRSRQDVHIDYDARRSSVAAEWIRLRLTPVGEFVIMHAEDVSQQRREEAVLRAIVEQAAEIIVMTDRDGRLSYVNPFTVAVLGRSSEELLGREVIDFMADHDRDWTIRSYAALKSGKIQVDRHRIQIIDRHGQLRTLSGSTVPFRAPTGEFDGLVIVTTDITDRINSEDARNELAAALSVAEQQERARVAGDIHDGPVQRLASLSMLLGAGAARSPDGVASLLERSESAVIDSISELRSLMFQLSPPDLEGVGLGHAIRNRAEMLFDDTTTSVQVEADLEFVPSKATSATIFRLAQEAMVNARKHADASNVSVHLHTIDSDPSRSVGSTGKTLVLEIRDDGRGVDTDGFEFEQPGHLGVAMIFDRARQLGGRATISSAPGQGTTVRVAVPL